MKYFSQNIKSINKINVPWLEIPLTEHCNLKCKGCTHHSPYLKPNFYKFEQFTKDIDALKDIYHVHALTFLGGEPLLNRRINDYIKFAKNLEIADIYRVVTNGILLFYMDDIFFDLIDDIQISLYPDAGVDRQRLESFLNEKQRKYNFNYNINNIDYFMNIETDELTDKEAQINFQHCFRRRVGHLLYNGYYYKCMRPLSTQQYLFNKCSIANPPNFRVEDGVEVNDLNLYMRLKEYISCKQKLLSCHYCLLGFNDNNFYIKLKSKIVKYKYARSFLYNMNFLYYIFKKINNQYEKNKYNIKENPVSVKNTITIFEHKQLCKDEYESEIEQ